MKMHRLDDYYDNESFLELVEEYEQYDDFYDLRSKITDEVAMYVNSAQERDDGAYSLSEAKTLINVFQYILDQRREKKYK